MSLDDGSATAECEHLFDVLQSAVALQQRGETDVEKALRHLNEVSVASVPGARYGGLTLVDEAGGVSSIGATDHYYARTLDDLQSELGEGPCLSAAWTTTPCCIDDMATETPASSPTEAPTPRTSVPAGRQTSYQRCP